MSLSDGPFYTEILVTILIMSFEKVIIRPPIHDKHEEFKAILALSTALVGKHNKFLKGCRKFFKKTGFLTPKQVKSLAKLKPKHVINDSYDFWL